MTRRLRRQLARGARRGRPVLATLAAAGLAGSAQANTSTTLTGLPDTNMDVPVTHGSNAEVTLAWATEWDQYAGWDDRGDVYQIDQPTATITFTPTAGSVSVAIQEWQFDEWAGGGDTVSEWSITGSLSGPMASGVWNLKNTANDPNDSGGRTLITSGAAGAPGETLTLSFDHSGGGTVSYLAIDNLVFRTSIIPEPATAALTWLGVGGLGAHAMRRRRK